ncbi:MAG: hypothetical protein PVSMB7_27480 [Chloroflexota bacterium]
MSERSKFTDSTTLSPLQIEAWEVWNASFHVDVPDAYRGLAEELYHQDVLGRIAALYARLDEQNAQLDAIVSRGTNPAGC